MLVANLSVHIVDNLLSFSVGCLDWAFDNEVNKGLGFDYPPWFMDKPLGS